MKYDFIYDLIIIGTGISGYTAAIYASRYNIDTLLIGSQLGGSAINAHKIENWPGEISISGSELMKKIRKHVEKFRVPIKQESVKTIKQENDLFNIYTDGGKFQSKTLILALGTKHRQLSVPGEKEFRGKGVSYCATCDGIFFKKKNIAVIGGGNSAFMAANQMSDIAKKVYVVYIEDQPKASPSWVDRVKVKNNVQLIPKNTIVKIYGNKTVEKVQLKKKFKNKNQLIVDGVFIEIGVIPNDKLISDLKIEKSEHNYIKVNPKQETNIPGIFAAGDITTGSAGFAQLITASSEGAIAALSVYKYLKKKNID